MDTSVLLNWIFGGGLLAALTALVTLGPTVRKAKAEAEKAKADAETVRIDNTEHATPQRVNLQEFYQRLWTLKKTAKKSSLQDLMI